MSENLNSVTLSGNLGADALVKTTSGGTAVTTMTLAVKERRAKGDGTYGDVAQWVDVTIFGKRGEALQPYLTKGAKIAITGHLRSSSWEKDGQRHRKLEVVADQVELMTMPRDKQEPVPTPATPSPSAQTAPRTSSPAYDAGLQAAVQQGFQAAGVYDDEIPF